MKYSIKAIRRFIILFSLCVYILFYFVSTGDKDHRVDLLLKQQIKYLNQNYKITTHHFKTISDNIYNSVLTRPDVLKLFYQANRTQDKKIQASLRQKLYQTMRPYFEYLKKSGVNIMLFSFPDNKTFLRVHKLNKFDDDLSKVRYSFTYANVRQKPVRGFEQGKISHAFRNIKPLYYKGVFLGSVDVSFSSEVMQENMRRIHGVDTHFILNKNLFAANIWQSQNKVKYLQSIEHKDFLFSVRGSKKDEIFTSEKLDINKELQETIAQKIRGNDAFSLYTQLDKSAYIISFSPIRNIKDFRSVAYLVSYVDSVQLYKVLDAYLWVNIIFLVGLVLLSSLTYRNIHHRLFLGELVKEEVSKNREKDFILTQQARHAQMGEMISMIAHQWRQPLAAISATVNTLLMGKMSEDDKDSSNDEKLQRISDYTHHLSATINDFRNFFKEEKKPVHETLENIVDDSLSMVENILKSDGILVERDYCCEEPLLIYANELKQVILNLIKNAHDAIKDKDIKDGKISIQTSKENKHYFISVSDNAGGIAKAIFDKIFDPYFTTKDALNGTGLGLYMSKKIVEEHCHGRLKVHNNKEGACFTIELMSQKA